MGLTMVVETPTPNNTNLSGKNLNNERLSHERLPAHYQWHWPVSGRQKVRVPWQITRTSRSQVVRSIVVRCVDHVPHKIHFVEILRWLISTESR